jgi:dCMP deaminase
MARLVSTWSKDPSTQTGAVIVRPDKSVASVGFNGFSKKMLDTPERLQERKEKYSRIVHCEMNAALFAREPLIGYTLYTYPFASCDRCAAHMLQAGIMRFVFPQLPADKTERWSESVQRSLEYMRECGAQVVEVPDWQVTE